MLTLNRTVRRHGMEWRLMPKARQQGTSSYQLARTLTRRQAPQQSSHPATPPRNVRMAATACHHRQQTNVLGMAAQQTIRAKTSSRGEQRKVAAAGGPDETNARTG